MKTKLSVLISMFAAASVFAAGDIYEIRPCTENGVNTSPYATYENPLGSGTSNIYFNVRLKLRGDGNNPNRDDLRRKYTLEYWDPTATYQEIYDAVQNPLKIGIYVSGKLRTASLQAVIPNSLSGTNFFDCVFMYKPQAGDFALPVRLAVEDDSGNVFPADENDTFTTYHFENANLWKVRYYDEDNPSRNGEVVWKFCDDPNTPGGKRPSGGVAYTPMEDYSLKAAGIYVQTVDFDQGEWELPGEYWREVAMGDELECFLKVDSEATGAIQDSTFYVWSMDETVVKVQSDESPVEIVTNIDHGVQQKTTVSIGTVTIRGGSVTKNFYISGIESNKIAKLVLSPWKGFSFGHYTSEILKDYKTIPVKCGPPPVPSVNISFDKDRPSAPSAKKLLVDPSTNYLDRAADAVPVYITLSQPYETDLHVNVTVRYEKNAARDPIADKFLSVSQNGDEYSSSDIYYTNVLFRVGETQQTVYVYPLGGNADTKSEGIGFYPVVQEAAPAAIYEPGDRALLQINSLHAPVILQPKTDYDYGTVSGAAGEGFDISLLVNDCLRDMENTNGFTVTFGGALKAQPATNIVFTAGETFDFTVTGYDKKKEGLQIATIKVTEPAEPGVTPKSAIVQVYFTVAVEKDKLVYVSLYDTTAATSLHDGTLFTEGTAPIPMFYVNEPMSAGESIYFFLRPLNDASSNLVNCAAFTQGVELVGGQTNTVRSSAFAMSLTDGCALTESTGSLEYEIFARTSPKLDEGSASNLYIPAQKLVINVANVFPLQEGLYIAGNPNSVPNGGHYLTPISSSVTNSYVAAVTDVSEVDISNGLYVIWNFTEGYAFAPSYEYAWTFATNDTVQCMHAFETEDATQTVQYVAIDKDMLAVLGGTNAFNNLQTLWPRLVKMVGKEGIYKATVYVSNRPYIKLLDENDSDTFVIDEDVDKNDGHTLKVMLSEPAMQNLQLKVKVKSYSDYTDAKQIGTLKFNTETLAIAKGKTVLTGEFKELKYDYHNLDGAPGSSDAGFFVTVEVVSPAALTNYYQRAEAEIYINNRPPVISPKQGEVITTNKTIAAGEPFALEWSAKDEKIDMASGLTAKWYIDDMIQNALTVVGITNNEARVTSNIVINAEGLHEVKLVVSDKDGEDYDGIAERRWLYYIAPTKKLQIRPFGPASTTESYYDGAAGVGKGRVFADGTRSTVQAFVQTWFYNVETSEANMYAAGYPSAAAPYADNGLLGTGTPKRDLALNPFGEKWTSGDYYQYDGEYDNFFYRWVYVGVGSDGGAPTSQYSKVEIQTVSGQEAIAPPYKLTPFEANKVGYETRIVEAVFSREMKKQDNLGDINADGVPDLFIKMYKFNVFDAQGNLIGADAGIDSLAAWDDGDYLPGSTNLSVQAAWGVTNTWNIDALPFDTVMELRGMDGANSHFNDAYEILSAGIGTGKSMALIADVKADKFFTMPYYNATTGVQTNESTLSVVEYIAFTNYCAKMGWDPADESHWGLQNGSYDASWSPERPTDPTKADTDGDLLSDGFEYFLWYHAHVGELVDGELVQLVGRRYNQYDPGRPIVISSEEIERLFDPLTKSIDVNTRDTDNDGLTDLEEFALGTSPIDWDTDGDGLPDGWEVHYLHSDPLKYATVGTQCDALMNEDKDAMAWMEAEMHMVAELVLDAEGKIIGTNNVYFSDEEFATIGNADSNRYLRVDQGADFFCYTGWVYGVNGPWAIRTPGTTNITAMTNVLVSKDEKVKVVRLHYQVYHHEGFDPRTGWNMAPCKDNHILNTKDYTALDEFLLQAFYWCNFGILPEDMATASYAIDGKTNKKNILDLWAKTCTDPNKADTDDDSMPDGWELYVQAPVEASGKAPDPETYGPGCIFSPKVTYYTEPPPLANDGLLWPEEFAGIESCFRYSECPTIVNPHPEWQNKVWPTDPWVDDTDGDGVIDGEERLHFVYGDKVRGDEEFDDCIEGGGLNPNFWDTDLDMLPDPWEVEFEGANETTDTPASTNIIENADGTLSTNVTEATSTTAWNGGMNGTLNDAMLDYDNDGLKNWQEYMVGTMRCWRYDDTITTWTFHEPDLGRIAACDNEYIYGLIVNPESPDYNPGLRGKHVHPGVYMSWCNNKWDPKYGKFYYLKDGIYHDLKIEAGLEETMHQNRWHRQVPLMPPPPFSIAKNYPSKYICCDPRNRDTDADGMDDFYELFHGLNPLYGTIDIVSESWDVANAIPWTAINNYWTYSVGRTRTDYELRLKGNTNSPYDFFQYPWLAGEPTADPDGDNIRNIYESIQSHMQAESTFLHTDPTPLWMTDMSYPDSLTYRFYYMMDPYWNLGGVGLFIHPTGMFTHTVVDENGVAHTTTYELNDFPWLHWDAATGICEVNYDIDYWSILDTMYSFEQNEGYDTDGDYLGDFEESQGKTKSASNPQDFDDPLRRQAMYFGGKDDPGFLQTSLVFNEMTPSGGIAPEDHMFLYFTVECWAKADASGLESPDLQVMVERPIWTGAANAADESYLRKNFLIGLKGGRWYTKFDSTGVDRKQAVEITDGPAATTNWTHIAATYDGTALKLYVNGVCCNTHKTSIQPEHGVAAAFHDFGLDPPDDTKRTDVIWADEIGNRAVVYQMISILVGADAKTYYGIAPDLAWHERSIMTGVAPYYFSEASAATLNDYTGYFKGYIDEVRIWDGARPAADILSDVKTRKRYNRDDALSNRSKVLGEIRSGRGRSPLSTAMLSPELRYHWSFDHVPGAVDAADVSALPAGFKTSDGTADGMAVWARPVKVDGSRWVTPWLLSIDESIRSRIYTDLAWVPWIRNTVSHLPRVDGLTRDSLFWSENFAGGVPATAYGLPNYDFARTAETQCSWYQQLYVRPDGTIYSQDYPTYKGDLYQFAMRETHTEGDDLIPLGGVYAKRISATEGGMWDDLGAADAWAETVVDSDHNGLPDWWEQYARQNLSADLRPWDDFMWDTTVIYNGLEMPAWRAYLRDLALGLLPDGKYHDGTNGTLDYRDTRDLDHDGMPDWWEDMYGIDTGSVADAKADPDNDGLSNYQEYRIEQDSLYMLNPSLTRTFVGQVETDYFLQTTNAEGRAVYLGELYADHDFMEDDVEDVNGYDRTRYDAYADPDEDGWSNFAEMRYAGFKMDTAARFATHYFAQTEVKDFPIPVVHATLRYHGDTGTGSSTNMIYIEAYSGNNLQKSPSAVYAVTPGSTQSRTIYLGEYSDRVYHGTLTPGHVQAGKDNIQLEGCFIQQNEKWTWLAGGVMNFGTYEEMYRAFCADPTIQITRQENQWFQLQSMLSSQAVLQISVDDKTQKGYLYLDYARVGEIDMITGDFSIDLTPIRDYFMADTLVAVPQLFFRINYKTMLPTMQNNKLTISLAEPDQGILNEGKTAFVAWMDKDGNGVYTPGVDPIGFVKDVEVGWDQVPAIDIEMTDASQAAGQRFSYATASNDVVRVVRIGVNGETEGFQPRIIFSRDRNAMTRDYVFEGDLVSGGKYGLDWDNLRADLQALEGVKLRDVTSVNYAVVDGACSMQNLDTNLFITTFAVNYTSEPVKPTVYSPSEKADGIVETVRPTFRWTGADGYTAFRLQIYDETGATKLYDSDVQTLPARDSSSRYYWTAPVFIGTNVLADAWALDNHKSYKWRVAMYNQKFSETTDGASLWSDWATMRAELADTNDKSTLYGTVKTVVKYFGPATNTLDQVVVQLFKNADLTGVPAAQTRLFDVSGDISDLTNGIEVVFHGLEDGEYYACAFIDRADPETGAGDCIRQRYETWGYSAQVGLGYSNIWNPLGVKSAAESVKIPSVTVYMEDTDVNGDDILDWDQDEELLKVASTSAGESALAGDSDGDGLSDFDEGDKSYTKANMWDTDGDGMPDGWEYLFAGTDPLTADADKVVDGDLMAYAEYASRVITVRATATGAEETYIIPGTNEYFIGDNVNGQQFYSTFDYNGSYGRGGLVTVEDSEQYNLVTVTNTLGGAEYKVIFEIDNPVVGVGTNVNEETGWIPEGPDGGPYILGAKTNLNVTVLAETNLVTAVETIDISLGENRVIAIDNAAKVVLVHAQVYDEFGFTQTTAVDPADEHTKPFTALDKYLVIRYLSAIGIGPGEEEINKKKLWKYYSLIPMVKDGDGISDLTDDKSAIKQVKDATDKYGDGIADGWELYVMFGTNGVTNVVASATMKPAETEINPWKYGDRALDVDGDALDLVHEYSDGKDPSDPWDPYSVYKLILAEGVIEAETLPFLDSEVRRFGVKKDDIDDDWDLDMISNGQEVWGYYKDRVALADICETNAWSDGFTPDYFRALTNLTPVTYLGEIYNGAEFIEPQVRKLFGIQDLQRAGTRDLYNSGWDIWSIVRGSIYKREQTGVGEVSEDLSYCVKFLYAVWPDEFTGATQDDVIQFVNDHYQANVSTLDGVITTLGGMDYIKRTVKEHSANSFDVAGYAIPEPEVNVKFRYYGNDAHDIVVEAYQTSSTYPERGEQMTASWSVAPLFDSGTAYVTLKATSKGTLKQGKCRFLAYIDNDGSSTFSAADTFAVATANIGFAGAYVEMTLGDPNLGFPAFTFNDGSNFVSQIKIVRTHINGMPFLDEDGNGPHTVYHREFANNVERLTVFPDDYIWDGTRDDAGTIAHYIGVDKGIDINTGKYKKYAGFDVESVTYEILEGIGPFTVSNLTEYAVITSNKVNEGWVFKTNVVSGIGGNKTFTINYSKKRDIADVNVVADQLEDGDVYAAFTIPTDTPATKFWLKWDGTTYPSGSGIDLKNFSGRKITCTEDTGYPISGSANGLVRIKLSDYLPEGEALVGVHELRICLGNDRFSSVGADNEWSQAATFSVGEKATRNGKITVIVKHPLTSFGNNVTVAVYDRPDFANPVAIVRDGNGSTDSEITINNLRENGEYYVAAWYIKDDADGRSGEVDSAGVPISDATVRMPYDTWGYVSAIGTVTNGFNALAIKAESKVSVTNYVWLQDTDWNDNGKIDRSEDFFDIDGITLKGGGTKMLYIDDFDLDGLPDNYEEQEEAPEEEEEGTDNKVTSKDVMAYYEASDMLFVGLSNTGGDSNLVWCAVVDRDGIDHSFTLNDGSLQLQTPASALGTLYSTYDYYYSGASPRKDSSKWQGIGTNVTYDSTWTVQRMRTGKAKFVHAQVYSLFGFDPKTCVGDDDAVNTKNFTRNDRYLVCRYLEAIGVEGVSEKDMSDSGNWIWSLKAGNKLDQDRDSVADGWELYVMFGPDTAKYDFANGAGIIAADLTNSVPAQIISPFDGRDGQAYSYADQQAFPAGAAEDSTNLWLKIAQEFDNGQSPTDPWTIDSDADGIADYIAFYYNVKGANSAKDDDGDGLSNYAEYLISEVFRFTKLDPKNAKTDGACIDYFRKAGEFYFGEMFTDHDRVNDNWEDYFGAKWTNSGIFDPFDDPDDDGWSNYAEFMAGTDPTYGRRADTVNPTNGELIVEASYPVPTIKATIVYNGSASIGSSSFLIKAWTDAEMKGAPDAAWVAAVGATNTPSVTTGRAVTFMLKDPEPVVASAGDAENGGSRSDSLGGDEDSGVVVKKPTQLVHNGGVREGRNTFVVFADLDGNQMYTAGEPFGVVNNVNVGWNAAEFMVELTDTHPVFARLDITDAVNDREDKYGEESGNWDQVTGGHVSGGDLERVRVVRTLIDGIGVDDPILVSVGVHNGNRVVMDKWLDVANCRCVIHEGDFLTNGCFDIDWEFFDADIGPAIGKKYNRVIGTAPDFHGNPQPITEEVTIAGTSVVYRVVLGNCDISTALTNNLVSTAIVRKYDFERVAAIPVSVDNDNGVVYSAAPTFNWKMPYNLNSYTAFELEIADADTGATVYDSGMRLVPVMKGGMYSWKADPIVGIFLAKSGNWKWRVAMCNAKFKTPLWSDYANFSTAVNTQQPLNDHGYSSIGVSVKYTGPSVVLNQLAAEGKVGKLVIEAYTANDFSGAPVAAAYATDKTSVSDPSILTNDAVLVGLDANGTYYIRAFIDSNGNGVKDDFESWGYSSEAIKLAGRTTVPVVGFYLEDADTDGDWLPDAWEYAEAGWTGDWEDVKKQKEAEVLSDGKVLFSTSLETDAISKLTGFSSYAKGASLTIFENGSAVTGLIGDGSLSAGGWTFDSIREAVNGEIKVREDSVKIAAVTLDYATGKVHLFVDAEVAMSLAGKTLSQIYAITPGSTKTVSIKIFRKASLAQAAWVLVDTKTASVGADAVEVTVDTGIGPADIQSGFYKVEVCE